MISLALFNVYSWISLISIGTSLRSTLHAALFWLVGGFLRLSYNVFFNIRLVSKIVKRNFLSSESPNR